MAPEYRKGLPTFADALRLLRRYVSDETTIRHSLACSVTAFEIATEILRLHPNFQVSPEKVRLGGLLHDIGKARPGEHEINSAGILKEEGFPDLADIVVHSYPYEIFLLRGTPRPEYLPVSLENKIVVYADLLIDQAARRLTMVERIAEIKKRKKDQPERMAALALAEPRLYALRDEIENLLR